jgi:hypothetical protein
MVDIATGEVSDREPTPEERGVDPAASAFKLAHYPFFAGLALGSPN